MYYEWMKNDHLEGFHQLLFCSFELQKAKEELQKHFDITIK